MSPEARSSSSVLNKLRASVAADRDTLAKLHRQLVDASATATFDAPMCAYVALKLHAFYGAVESTMERIARQLDLIVPSGSEWHKELIQQMTFELPGTRPALFTNAIAAALHKLLAFRHFIRHAYAIELDPAELHRNIAIVERIWPELDAALAAHESFLLSVLAALAAG